MFNSIDVVRDISYASEEEWAKIKLDYGKLLWDDTHLNSDNCAELLLIFKKCMEHFNLEFWLTYGTALGFYRDGDFIPWDDDIDTHVDGGEFLEAGINNIKDYLIEKGVVVRSRERGLNSKMSLFYKKEKLQVQGVYEEDGMIHAKLFFYPKEFYENWQSFTYRGEKYRLPGPADEYLTFCYDKDWKTPQDIKDWRDYMNPNQLKDEAWKSNQKKYLSLKENLK